MKGGVILFRGSGADSRRYLESDRSRADDYYLEGGVALAEFAVMDGMGEVFGEGALTPDEYAAWVDWINPFTGESMGTPRQPGDGKQGSPRFAEMVVNAPKSLSIAAALHPEVSEALDRAQQDAVAEIQHWLAQHSVTRVGPRGKQEVVPVEALQTEGGRWIPNFDPSSVTNPVWGQLKFSFTDCNHGRVDFTSSTPGYGEGHMDLTRLTRPAGLACP